MRQEYKIRELKYKVANSTALEDRVIKERVRDIYVFIIFMYMSLTSPIAKCKDT